MMVYRTTPRLDRVIAKAQKRKERRWQRMAAGRTYAYGIRAVDLYVEAIHLEDRLTENRIRLMTEGELDGLHEAIQADIADLAASEDAPLAAYAVSDVTPQLASYWERGA